LLGGNVIAIIQPEAFQSTNVIVQF
jgi:hypothetical protein